MTEPCRRPVRSGAGGGGQRHRARGSRRLSGLAAASALILHLPASARAQDDAGTEQSGSRSGYVMEVEPHALLSVADPRREYSQEAWGLGLRLSVPVIEYGAIRPVRDSVGISLGLDWARYEAERCPAQGVPRCAQTVPGVTPPDTAAGGSEPIPICVEVEDVAEGPGDSSVDAHYFYFPVAVQFNFWLMDHLSVFIEPGVIPYLVDPSQGSEDYGVHPLFSVGLRGRFGKRTTLTLRLGYPTLSLGVSFLPPPKPNPISPRMPPAEP